MNNENKDTIFASKQYQIGCMLVSIGMLINGIGAILKTEKYAFVMGEKLISPTNCTYLFALLAIVGTFISYKACKKHNSRYTKRLAASNILAFGFGIALVGILIAFPTNSTFTYDKVQTADGAEFNVFVERFEDNDNRVYICDLHCGGLVAKKVHTYRTDTDSYKLAYDKQADNYVLTVYYDAVDEILPLEYKIEKDEKGN